MRNVKILHLWMLLIILLSCTNEINNDFNAFSFHEKNINLIKVKDGVLHFESREHLSNIVHYFKNLKDDEKKFFFHKFYDINFFPLYPHFYDDEVNRIDRFLESKRNRDDENLYSTNKNQSSSKVSSLSFLNDVIDIDDDLIADNDFASFLTFDREIGVENKLYRYTDKGIISSKSSNSINIKNAYNNLNKERRNSGDYKIDDDVMLKVPQIDKSVFPNVTIKPKYNSVSVRNTDFDYNSDADLLSYFKSLVKCDKITGDLRNGQFFGLNIFGRTVKCYSNHSNNNRSKTKFFQQNYYFYKSIGLKVTHQKRGLWWKPQKTDEVALFVESAIIELEPPNQIPDYSKLKGISNNYILYQFDGKLYDNLSKAYSIFSGWSPPKELLFQTPFADDIIIIEYVNFPIFGKKDWKYKSTWINQSFWKSIWEGVKNSGIKGVKRGSYVLFTKGKYYIYHFDFLERKKNEKKIKKIFFEEIGGTFSLTLHLNERREITNDIQAMMDKFNEDYWLNLKAPPTYEHYTKLGFSVHQPSLTDITDYEIKLVGATNKKGTWRGSKLVVRK